MERLRHIREQAGYSQQDLADESGVSQHTISEIELGRRKPQGRTLRKLAKVLDVQVADFYGTAEYPLAEAPPSQPSFNHLLAEERRNPTPYELHAIETLDDFCDRLDAFLSAAKPTKEWAPLWSVQAHAARDMAAVSLPLAEKESTRLMLVPVAVRLVPLADQALKGALKAGAAVTEEEAERSREEIRQLTQEIA